MQNRTYSTIPSRILAAVLLTAGAAFSQCSNLAIPGKFYEYYIIAQTGNCNGNNFSSLGASPAINDFAQVAFMGQTTSQPGSSLWVGDGHNNPAVLPINPGEIGSSEIYDAAVQLSSAYPTSGITMVSKDSITTTSPATTSIRVWTIDQSDTFRYAGRGGPSQTYGAVFPFPSVNKKGDAAFIALDQSNPLIKYLVLNTAAGKTSKTTVNVSVGEPMVDDSDDVLLYTTNPEPTGNFQITLYTSFLSGSTVIADSTNFSSIDSAPGISRDGSVIAFQGNLTATGAANLGGYPGPGIFVANRASTTSWVISRITGIRVETPNSGGNNNGYCDPGETCQPGAELGYDDSGNAIYFNPSGYGVGTRVAVTNLALGASGAENDVFVISFIGTPSEASRENPVLKNGTPLLFSAQQGLWTIRVDMEPFLATSSYGAHARTAIPVVQIGDHIGSNVVASIGAYDAAGNAAVDETGAVRTMRRGDHRVAFWASNTSGGQFIARGNHLDSDQDGLLDHWETTGIDMDQDGIVDLDLPAMGANVNSRDVFLQMDWTTDASGLPYSYQPSPGVISPAPGQGAVSPLLSMFDNAPSLTGNLYGARIDGQPPDAIAKGVTLHIDGGTGSDKSGGPFSLNMGSAPLDGGGKVGATGNSQTGYADVLYFSKPNSVTIPNVNARSFQDVKDNYFGSHDKDGRELAFHFGVLGPYFAAWQDSSNAYSWHVASAESNILTSASPLPPMASDNGKIGLGDVVKITSGTGAGQYLTIDHAVNSTTLQMMANWTTIPDITSTFSIFYGNLGNSEVYFWPSPDNNSLPGNDFMVSTGPTVVPPLTADVTPAGLTGTPCLIWRTLAHELGHTLGLRHGGTDQNAYKGDSYLSLMSYSWSLECNTQSSVQSYSGATDPTFNDWANLQHNFADSMIHLGNTEGLAFGTFPEDQQGVPELSFADYVNINGPTDTTPPVVSVKSPAANAKVGLTLPLQVTVDATDNVQVASVSVSFDVNGDGIIEPSEILTAKSSGTGTYTASFPALSGPLGARTITASAVDPTGNNATAKQTVNVVNPNPKPSLTSLSPSSATHGGPGFTLTVNGSSLVSGCTVMWNGAARTTTFVNSGQVTAKIQASDIAAAGSASVTVKNPSPGGGTSNALTFTIN